MDVLAQFCWDGIVCWSSEFVFKMSNMWGLKRHENVAHVPTCYNQRWVQIHRMWKGRDSLNLILILFPSKIHLFQNPSLMCNHDLQDLIVFLDSDVLNSWFSAPGSKHQSEAISISQHLLNEFVFWNLFPEFKMLNILCESYQHRAVSYKSFHMLQSTYVESANMNRIENV